MNAAVSEMVPGCKPMKLGRFRFSERSRRTLVRGTACAGPAVGEGLLGAHARSNIGRRFGACPLGWTEEASVARWIRSRNINTENRLIAAFTSAKTPKYEASRRRLGDERLLFSDVRRAATASLDRRSHAPR